MRLLDYIKLIFAPVSVPVIRPNGTKKIAESIQHLTDTLEELKHGIEEANEDKALIEIKVKEEELKFNEWKTKQRLITSEISTTVDRANKIKSNFEKLLEV